MSGITVPTPEQQERAKWDLLLADLEYRGEQVRNIKSATNLLLTDLEHRAEQIRNVKSTTKLLPWQLVLSGMTTGAALFAAGAAFWKVLGP